MDVDTNMNMNHQDVASSSTVIYRTTPGYDHLSAPHAPRVALAPHALQAPQIQRPIPKRIQTLPLRALPSGPPPSSLSPFPSPVSPFSPFSPLHSTTPSSPSPKRPGQPGRPGPPKRAHSFCGDSSSPTFALASTSSRFLTDDKRGLVAPPLERTLSSLGHEGNMSPPGGLMRRPLCRTLGEAGYDYNQNQNPNRADLPTPPSSPTLPAITITHTSPPRPPLSTLRSIPSQSPHPPSMSLSKYNDLGYGYGAPPSLIHEESSRTSSFVRTPGTPGGVMWGIQEEKETNLEKRTGNWKGKGRGNIAVNDEEEDEEQDEEDVEMQMEMVVDQVEELVLGR